jgi:response regulator RpfG family c-di-GMP phosphodiesterase
VANAGDRDQLLLLLGEQDRERLQEAIATKGHETFAVDAVEEFLASVAGRTFSAAVIDLSRTDVDASDVVTNVLEADPDLAIVVIAAMGDATSAAICLQQGAFEFVPEPVGGEVLTAAVERAIRRRGAALQSQEIAEWLKHELVERTKELERERRKLEEINVATLSALINALEAKDPDFVGHSVRVAELAASVAAEMELSDDEIEAVRAAGRLHDIGKIGVRDEVLRKRGPLSEDELHHIREQVVVGFRILAPLSHLGSARQFVRSHHEHWDGTGYPDALKADEIPVGGRIVFAAEIYDAITSPRPYQKRLEPEAAIEQMRKLTGTKLDPGVVEALARVVTRRQNLVYLRDSKVMVREPDADIS